MSSAAVTKAATSGPVARNLDLIRGYLDAMMADPDQMESVPDDAAVVLLPQGDPDGFEENLAMAVALARDGQNVYLRHVHRDGRPL